MICTKCKKEISDENKFCPNCGSPIISNISRREQYKKVDNNGHYSGKKLVTNHKRQVIFLAIFILVISISVVSYFNKWKINKENTNNTVNTAAQTKMKNSNDNNKTSPKVSPEQAVKEAEKISNESNLIVMNSVKVSANDISGADELIGKYCYLIGGEGGNSVMYVVNSENGNIYECTSESLSVLNLVPANQKSNTAAKATNNTNGQNTIQYNANNKNEGNYENRNVEQNSKIVSKSSGLSYAIQDIKYSQGSNMSYIYLNVRNISNKYLNVFSKITIYDVNNKAIAEAPVAFNGVIEPQQNRQATAFCNGKIENYDHFLIVENNVIDLTSLYQAKKQIENMNIPH